MRAMLGSGGVLRVAHQVGVVEVGFRGIERKALARLQVGAGAKRLVAGAREHDHAHVGIGMCGAISGADAGDHLGVDRIALVRPVDRDPEGMAALVVQHGGGGVAHRAVSAVRAGFKAVAVPASEAG